MHIKFCGAAREVTGSAHLLTLDSGYTILLDCGLYQGHEDELEDFNLKFDFNPKEIDCLILSHAHIDHTGRVPKLVKDGYEGDIHATHATRSLCAIMLLDSAKIQEYDAKYKNKEYKQKGINKVAKPLYDSADVKKTMDMFTTYGYNRWYKLNEEVEVLFRDAGHILGSSSVSLRVQRTDGSTEVIAFTGDIGRPDRPILRDPVQMEPAKYVLCESTYGDTIHPTKPEESEKLLNIIKHTCINKKGKLIIPAFSVGRTQEIVFMLDKMATNGLLPRIPIYVDSPLAVNATQVFGAHPECYDQKMHEYLLIDEDPFGFNSLQYVRQVEVSKSLNNNKSPMIIISASGMMNAGRVKHHLFNNIDDGKNTVLIVGYCAPYTPGGKLKNGETELVLFGQRKQVEIEVVVMDSFSSHGDQKEMLDFLSNQKRTCKTLFLVHGEYETQKYFSKYLNKNGFNSVQIPKLGEIINLE